MYLSKNISDFMTIIQYINNEWFTGQTDHIQKLKERKLSGTGVETGRIPLTKRHP